MMLDLFADDASLNVALGLAVAPTPASQTVPLGYNQSLQGMIDMVDLGRIGHPDGQCVVCCRSEHLRYQMVLHTVQLGEVRIGCDCLEALIHGDAEQRHDAGKIARSLDRLARLAFMDPDALVLKNLESYAKLEALEAEFVLLQERHLAVTARDATSTPEERTASYRDHRVATATFETAYQKIVRKPTFVHIDTFGSNRWRLGSVLTARSGEDSARRVELLLPLARAFVADAFRKLTVEGRKLNSLDFDMNALARFVRATPIPARRFAI
jgi:hypothetical protein